MTLVGAGLAGPTPTAVSRPTFFPATIAFAASQGVPLARSWFRYPGITAMLGGLSILLGYRARLGALLLVLFLVPVTLALHAFWKVTDPMMAQMQLAMFMKKTCRCSVGRSSSRTSAPGP